MNGSPGLSLQAWAQAHLDVARDSLRRLRSNGLGSLLTVLMMGCALALPASLWVLTENATVATRSVEQQFSVSLYLADDVSDTRGRQLLGELVTDPLIQRGDYLSREDALAEFRDYSGFGRALDLLQDNPLPAVLVLWPAPGTSSAALQDWLQRQEQRAEISLAQADADWLARLQALLAFGIGLVHIMGALLALTVVLVVANTIRLQIASRREEILVMKLIGAPDGFIQRPFLYSGTLYGLLSGLVACLSVLLILDLLQPHISALSASYGSAYVLRGMSLREAAWLTGSAAALGWLGAFHSVWRHLRDIEPD